MTDFLLRLFDPSGFPPRWSCGTWSAGLGWLHIGSDLAVWAAYLVIPCVFVVFAARRPGLRFRRVFVLFAGFILLCGTTHLIEAVIFWHPVYRLAGVVKLLTAAVSWATVAALVREVPRVLAMRDPEELEREVADRRRAEDALRSARDELEDRVRERTAELAANEERFRVLTEEMPQLVWSTTAGGACDYLSRQWVEYTGVPAADQLPHGWLQSLHPDDRDRTAACWAAALAGRGDYDLEYRLRRHDGTYRWFMVRGRPVRGPAGEVVRWLGTCTDVDAGRQAAEALAERERDYRAIFDSAAVGISAIDPATMRCLRVNRQLAVITGYTRDELLHLSIGDLTHPDDWAADRADHETMLRAGGTHREVEKRYVCKDGRVIWVQVFATVVRDAAGRTIYSVGVILDVTARREAVDAVRRARAELEERVADRTRELAEANWELAVEVRERRRSEEQLRLSEERFRGAFDHANIGIALTTPDGRFARVNPALCHILGYPEAALIGRPFREVTHPDDVSADLGLVDKLLAGEIPAFRLEKRYLHKAGHVVWVSLSGSLVRDTAGAPIDLVGLIEDITPRKRAEEEARRARAQLLDAIESLDAGLVMYDPDERLVVCNSRYRELYPEAAPLMEPGTAYEHILREYCRAGGHRASGLPADEWVARRLAEHRNPGPAVEQRITGRVIRIGDRRTSEGGVVSLRTDITALKEAQEAAEAASRAKTEFLANISHEVRTPLNGVLGLTDLLLDTDLTADQRDSLAAIKSSADALLRVLDDLLDFAKIEAGMLAPDAVRFDPREVVGAAVRPFALPARARGVGFTWDIGPEVPAGVVGDPARVRQILLNLVGNAVKFTAAGSIGVTVAAPAPPPGGRPTLRFLVADTGIGVPAGMHRAIFEPFTQADGSTTRRYGGTGLGLSISARLVELMGGRIWVESEPGRGSEFGFEVPYELPSEAGPAGPPVFERRAALDRLGGDEALLAEVAGVFRSEAPRLVAGVRRAAAAGDAAGVRRLVHGIKGSAGYVGGAAVLAAAEAVERAASQDSSATGPALGMLEEEVVRLADALAAVASEPAAAAGIG